MGVVEAFEAARQGGGTKLGVEHVRAANSAHALRALIERMLAAHQRLDGRRDPAAGDGEGHEVAGALLGGLAGHGVRWPTWLPAAR